ncbi:MAG TPA: hypothetical protein VGK67_35170 [Myxococcales bacterium]|jgi:uncharacterized membrane protein
MNLDPTSIFVSVLIGIVGLAMLGYGKSQKRAPQILAGLALMVFPYFVSNVVLMVVIAVALLGLTWLAIKLGL